MKPVSFWLALVLMNSAAMGATVNSPYQIGTWAGFRTAAISLTFDDSCSNQFTIALPMLNQKGLKVTLFSCTGTMFAGWPALQAAAASGHEIASHTVTHSSFSGMSAAQQLGEMTNSQAAINANVTTQKCVTLAYPYCVAGNDSLTAQYYISARTCSGQIVPSTPGNFMEISSFVCGPAGSVQTLQNFTAQAAAAATAKGWCVYLIHGIDNDGGYSPLPSATLQQVVNYFSTNQDRFWVQPFGNVTRYIQERNGSSVIEVANQGDALTLQVTNTLDPTIFNCPLTLRRPLPAGWPAAAVSQNGSPVPAQLGYISSTNYVTFDVVPNAGEVVLAKQVTPIVLSQPALNSPSSFTLRLDGQAGVRYALCASSDLLTWAPIQTNTLASASTNLTLPAPGTMRFYRAQWAP